jgi:hypothetical protein
VISGRARRDVRRRLRGVPLQDVVGNHGIELGRGAPPMPAEVERWVPLLRHRLAHLKGVQIENRLSPSRFTTGVPGRGRRLAR